MQMMRLIVLSLLTMLLVACQNVPKNTEKSKPAGQELELNNREQYSSAVFSDMTLIRGKVSAWKLSGSFSYVDPNESGAGRIQWDFKGDLLDSVSLNDFVDQERVRLIGPIGVGSVELNSQDRRATLTSGRQEYKGTDAESLLWNIVGWRLPVSEMRFWLFGMPSPNVKGRFWLNEQGQLQALQQSGWEIQFERYEKMDDLQQDLPKKITAVHRENKAKVKLVIKRFTVVQELR